MWNLGGRMMPGQRVTEEFRTFGLRRYLVVSTLLMAATLMAAPLVSAALTSVVTDPVGDAMPTPGIAAPSYLDIVKASITSSHGQFVFVTDLAAPIPNSPPLLPPGIALIDWAWQLNTDPTKTVCGFPGGPGASLCIPVEFIVIIFWDGTSFTGMLIDRRPLLTGGNAILTAVPFNINGSEVIASSNGAMIDNPLSFGWRALTDTWSARFGTDSFHAPDFAPDNGFAPWPG